MSAVNKRILVISLGVLTLLSIPLIAMQFTNGVNWKWNDFLVAGVLLFGAAFLINLTARKIRQSKYRVPIIVSIALGLILVWAEMAVGFFGSPIAGN